MFRVMKRRIRSFLVLLIFAVSFPAKAWITEAYGDSLTAGFLAHTSLTSPPPRPELSRLLEELAFGFIQKDRKILQSFESNEKAWPYFLVELLKSSGISIEQVVNLAVSGSKSAGIPQQVALRKNIREPVLAFFFVGHNDLCHVKGSQEELVSQFSSHLDKSLGEWGKNHRNSIVFIIPTGPIQKLYPALEDHIWFESEKRTFQCQDAWMKYFPYCPSFYVRHRRGELENYLSSRGAALNESLKNLVSEKMRTDSFGNRYFYLDAQWPLPLKPDYFAVDCYHIAEMGQRLFAQNLFDAIQKLALFSPPPKY